MCATGLTMVSIGCGCIPNVHLSTIGLGPC